MNVSLFSQFEDANLDKEDLQHEIGLNVSQFVNQFFSPNSNAISFQPYLLTYKSTRNMDTYFRGGLGFSFIGTSEDKDTASPAANNVSAAIRIRLGFEKQWDISDKWLLTYGLDFPLEYSYANFISNSDFQDVTINSSDISGGLGPVIGFHYKINDKLKVGTEATMYLLAEFEKDKTVIDTVEQSDESRTSLSWNIRSPLAIYFSVLL